MYSEEQKEQIINDICDKVSQGIALRNVLKENISSQTFYSWIDSSEIFSKQYARALELRAEAMFEDIITISDDQGGDVIIDEEGNEVTNWNIINRAKLRVDSRKWILSKMLPKKYGDKSTLALEGGEKPIEISFED